MLADESIWEGAADGILAAEGTFVTGSARSVSPSASPPAVRAVIFDISGTTLDFGSRGPVVAFVELFARHGVAVTPEEVRRPMGLPKRDHIRAMLAEPSIAARWGQAHGAKPEPSAVDALYEEFTPLQIEVLKRHCDVIAGVPEVVRELRRGASRSPTRPGSTRG